MSAIKSLLKASIEALPETYVRKSAAGATADLAKKGVKAEELEFAGLKLPEGKVTKQDLVRAEANRQDWFKTVDAGTDYAQYSLQPNNPTYKEKVLRFTTDADVAAGESRYTSAHFPAVKDYLAHTRVYDDTIEGQPTRVLQEIQSDLHQTARQAESGLTREQELAQLINDGDLEEANHVAGLLGIPESIDLEEWLAENPEYLIGSGIPESPYQKTWLKKSIERELVDAVNEGRQQLAIPIKGAVEQLKRGEGVQKWYETQVLNTAKKVAKQTNSDFTIVRQGGAKEQPTLSKVQAAIDKYEDADNFFFDKASSAQNEDVASAILDDAVADLNDMGIFLDEVENPREFSAEQLLKRANQKGVEYAVIKPKGQFSTTLYSTPSAAAGATYLAYKNGYTTEQVNQQLIDQGYDEDEIAEINSNAKFLKSAIDAGYNLEEAQSFLQSTDVKADVKGSTNVSPVLGVPDMDPFTGMPIPSEVQEETYREEYGLKPKAAAYDKLVRGTNMTPQEVVSAMQTIHPTMTSDIATSIPAWFGNEASKRRYDFARIKSRQKIVDLAKEKYNLNLQWSSEGEVGDGKWQLVQEDGAVVDVTPSLWQELKASSGEAILSATGAFTGYKLTPGPVYAKALGATGGAILGAIGGSQFDYLGEAIRLQEGLEAEALAYKSFNAAEMAVIGEAIGYPVAKSLGAGWKFLRTAKDMLLDGNITGAHQALKETLFMSDEEITTLTENLARVVKVPGKRQEQEITAVALTAPGVQDLVRAAGVIDSKASRAVINSIDKRAKEVLSTAESLTQDQAPQLLVQDLQNYTQDVKNFYSAVKAQAVQQPNGLNFTWDYDKLAVEPVLDRLSKNITDPAVSERYLLQAQRVRALSESRTFGDLLELRQLVNDFLYNKRIAKAQDKDMLRGVIKNIDNAIEQGAPSVLEKPQEWLDDWYSARKMYSNMKKVEQTAMYRAIFDKNGKVRPVQPETVVKALGKYITALDGNFEQVMVKIPYKGREVYEGAVVDALAQRYTAGMQGGVQAVNFPLLVNDLAKINFTTNKARAAKAAFMELGEVFKNDVALAQTSGMLQIPRFQSYLTADPVVRAKFELASGVFNTMKTYVPNAEQRNMALIRKTAKLIENPLDAKTSKELMEELSGEVNLTEEILKMQREAAAARAAGKDLTSPRLIIDDSGKIVKPGEGTTKIPMHRVATTEQVKTIADAEALTVHSPDLDKILKQRGFVAVQSGTDRVRKLK